MPEVNRKTTKLNREEATDALVAAWSRLLGTSPNSNQLALLLAQTALETGRWEQMGNYNFGNLIATGSGPTEYWGGDYFAALDSGNPRIFRSYDTAEEGATDYLRLLLKRPTWKQGLLSGEPVNFAKQLKEGEKYAYFEAPLDRYTATLITLWDEFGGEEVPHEPGNALATALVMGFGLGVFAWLKLGKQVKKG